MNFKYRHGFFPLQKVPKETFLKYKNFKTTVYTTIYNMGVSFFHEGMNFKYLCETSEERKSVQIETANPNRTHVFFCCLVMNGLSHIDSLKGG